MIINCRPSSSPPKYKVRWIKKIGYFGKVEVTKTFNTFADADGFARGMMKRGVFTFPLIKGS